MTYRFASRSISRRHSPSSPRTFAMTCITVRSLPVTRGSPISFLKSWTVLSISRMKWRFLLSGTRAIPGPVIMSPRSSWRPPFPAGPASLWTLTTIHFCARPSSSSDFLTLEGRGRRRRWSSSSGSKQSSGKLPETRRIARYVETPARTVTKRSNETVELGRRTPSRACSELTKIDSTARLIWFLEHVGLGWETLAGNRRRSRRADQAHRTQLPKQPRESFRRVARSRLNPVAAMKGVESCFWRSGEDLGLLVGGGVDEADALGRLLRTISSDQVRVVA